MSGRWLKSIEASNFRCFKKTGELELRPVNILVGENSSGKSSLLALSRIIADLVTQNDVPFNRSPFFLGSYDEIAFSAGRVQEPTFSVGCKIDVQFPMRTRRSSKGRYTAKLFVDFVNHNSQPRITKVIVEYSPKERLEVIFQKHKGTINLFELMYIENTEVIRFRSEMSERVPLLSLSDVWFVLRVEMFRNEAKNEVRKLQEELYRFDEVLQSARRTKAYAANPIRSQPRRTYDPVSSDATTDSNYALQNLASMKRTSQDQWRNLKATLENAGRVSKLFSGFDIRLLGKNESDPFQATVRIGGRKANIVDVGFGVSQMIPVIYDLMVVKSPLVLVQQPETHLHPAAQAGLGELIAQLPKVKSGQIYMIETHSDYIIDSIKVEVREGRAKPEDFAIWLSERQGKESVVHQMRLGSDGEILEQPNSYREFFLHHESRVLGAF